MPARWREAPSIAAALSLVLGAPALRWVALLGLCAFGLPTHAQQAAGWTAPAYRSLRYDEDYRYLQDPARRTDLWDPLKYIPLAGDHSSWLNFGGELRERFEWYSQPNFGLRGF